MQYDGKYSATGNKIYSKKKRAEKSVDSDDGRHSHQIDCKVFGCVESRRASGVPFRTKDGRTVTHTTTIDRFDSIRRSSKRQLSSHDNNNNNNIVLIATMLTNNNNKPNTSTKAPEIVPVSVVSNAAVTTTSTAGTSSTFRLPMTTDYFATAAANTMQMTTVQNQLVKFMGPATDPLSFFDTSTEGGHIVINLFYPHGEQGRQHFLQDIRRTKDPIASIRKIIALECTIQATTRTIQSRETFIKSLLYNKEFQAPWYADLLRQQSNALG
jgi:hypothetical protein